MKRSLRFVSVILSMALFLSVSGCQNTVSDAPVNGENSGGAELTAEPKEFVKIDDNGKPISDFDEFANRDIYAGFVENGNDTYSVRRLSQDAVNDRVEDMLQNTDLSTLDESDGLYKVIVIYRQITENTGAEDRMESIRAYLEPVMSIRTLDDLYAVYSDERYLFLSNIFRFKWRPDDYGDFAVYLNPSDPSGMADTFLHYLDHEEEDPYSVIFGKYTDALGLTDERIREICENACIAGGYANRCMDDFNNSENWWYLRQQVFEEECPGMPIMDILRKTGGLGTSSEILCYREYPQFLNEVYVPENIPILRDELLLGALSFCFLFTGLEDPSVDMHEVNRYNASRILDNAASDVIAAEYLNRYAKEGTLDEARALYDELKQAAIAIIDENDFLSDESKATAKLKVQRMHLFFGSNERTFDLSDVELTDDCFENIISLMTCYQRFQRKQVIYRDESRCPTYMNMLEVNAYYYQQLNAITLSATYLCDDAFQNAGSYEEKLGYLSHILAHEIGHAYDPRSMNYDRLGYYEPWLSPEESEEYNSRVLALADFYDGMTTVNGNTIDGRGVLREAVADLVGMQLCLKVLSERENPDYDTFFRKFAYERAVLTDSEGELYSLEEGYLPDKYRIDYTLAMCDKFYEIYDIDESSPYYVPEDKRIRIM